jgi:mono/diheme cytochrome c family protein
MADKLLHLSSAPVIRFSFAACAPVATVARSRMPMPHYAPASAATRSGVGTMLGFLCLALAWLAATSAALANPDGRRIYERQCADCHGANGEGVAGIYEEPLSGGRSLSALTEIIHDTMPQDDPEQCTGQEAQQVAEFIYQTFYTEESRAQHKPPRIELSRMTVRQYLNAAADLLVPMLGEARPDDQRGLKAQYYNSRNFRRGTQVTERTDPRVDFTFGDQSPQPGEIGNEEFSIQWRGAIITEETGEYEFVVKTENGVRLWVNNMDRALIDAWVKSGDDTEYRETIRLLGGRTYPIRLDFSKSKEPSASVALCWQSPRRALEVIPTRNLSPNAAPATLVINTPFPADDSSMGYERGTSVSQAWHEASTYAAIEIVNYVVENLATLAKVKEDDADRAARVQEFCHRFAERAFRRPLSDEQKRFFVDAHFEDREPLEDAVKRVVLLVLKSPRFLYTELGSDQPDDYDVASRLSFGLWDSLPDETLLRAAAEGQLKTPAQIASQAQRMLDNPRTRSKLRYFFHQWLQVHRADDASKDPQLYPDFDPSIVSDAMTSLDLMLEDIVWSPESDFRQLLLTSDLFVNANLARFYGLTMDEDADGFRKVGCDPQRQAGVLTHPFLMLAFAYVRVSSPIHRGVFLLRGVLGRALRPPPIAVAPDDEALDPGLTTRQRVALQTKGEACQACHSMINPLGFSLEHYDAVGRYREVERDQPIDASGSYKPVQGDLVEFTGARQLATYLAASDEVAGSFVQQLFHHLAKQPVNAYSSTNLDGLRDRFVESGYHIQKLMVQIMTATALEPGGAEARSNQ